MQDRKTPYEKNELVLYLNNYAHKSIESVIRLFICKTSIPLVNMLIDMMGTHHEYSVKAGHAQSVRHIEFTILSTIAKATECGFGYITHKHTRRDDLYTIKAINDCESKHAAKHIIANVYEVISVLFKQMEKATQKRVGYGHPYVATFTGAICSLCRSPIKAGQLVVNFTDNKLNKDNNEHCDGALHADCAEKTKSVCVDCNQKCASDTPECPLLTMLNSGIRHFL